MLQHGLTYVLYICSDCCREGRSRHENIVFLTIIVYESIQIVKRPESREIQILYVSIEVKSENVTKRRKKAERRREISLVM